MAYLDYTLSRPIIGLPQFKIIRIPETPVDGSFSGFRIKAGNEFGIDNYWRLTRGSIALKTSAQVADRKITFKSLIDLEGASQTNTFGVLGSAVAASSIGWLGINSLLFKGNSNILDFGDGLVWDNIGIGDRFIIKGNDHVYIDTSNPQTGDTMYGLIEFEFMNRTWNINERLDPSWQ